MALTSFSLAVFELLKSSPPIFSFRFLLQAGVFWLPWPPPRPGDGSSPVITRRVLLLILIAFSICGIVLWSLRLPDWPAIYGMVWWTVPIPVLVLWLRRVPGIPFLEL